MEKIKVVQQGDVYSCDIGISREEWAGLLKDEAMPEEYLNALLKFYYYPAHRGSCTAVSYVMGGNAQKLNANIRELGRYVQNRLNRFHVVRPDGTSCFWIIPMCEGKDLPKGSEGTFEWQLRPELVEAIRDYLYWNLVDRYKDVRKEVAIDDDNWSEIYKWDLITVSKGKSPFDIVRDHVAHPSNSKLGGFRNLIDAARDNKALKYLVDNHPSELKEALENLTDERQPLIDRLAEYKEKVKMLLPSTGFNSKANDERAASVILTCANPQKHTNYKYDVYTLFCKYLGEKTKTAGLCYEHFLELLKPLNSLTSTDETLLQLVAPSLQGREKSSLLLAQDILWILLIEFPDAMGHIRNLMFPQKQRVWLWSKTYLSDFQDTLEIGSSAKTIKDFTVYQSRNALRKAYQKDVGNGDLKIPDAYWSFINEVNVGDVVVVFEPKKGNGKQYHLLHGWGVITSDCMVNESNENPMSRTVQWRYFLKIPKQNEEMGNSLFFQGTTDEQALHIKELLDINTEVIMESKYQKYIDLLEANKNLILTGAPGTGKTFMAKAIAKEMDAEECFVQFHPSYDYTDFVEGLRPKNDENGNVGFERKDGVFKEFCKLTLNSSAVYTIRHTGTSFSSNGANHPDFEKVFKLLEEDVRTRRITQLKTKQGTVSVEGRLTLGNKESLKLLYDDLIKNNVYDLSPINTNELNKRIATLSKGKVQSLNTNIVWAILHELLNRAKAFKDNSVNSFAQNETISFDNAYDNMIRELRESREELTFDRPRSAPFVVSVGNDSVLRINGVSITKEKVRSFYEHTNKDNWYSKHCEIIIDYLREHYKLDGGNVEDADKNLRYTHPDILEPSTKKKPYVFIIDEINRGEISKIFGELFFSIDPGYRGEKGKVNTQYQNMIEEGDVFKDGFYVPENVYIIGTMNDIDRSVESMDFAMRRRFAWQEVTAAESYANMIENDSEFALVKDEIKARMFNLNKAITETEGLDEAYQIGAAYFRKYLDYKETAHPFDCLWENHLKGLLFEYLRGNRRAKELLEKLNKAYNNTNFNEQSAHTDEG